MVFQIQYKNCKKYKSTPLQCKTSWVIHNCIVIQTNSAEMLHVSIKKFPIILSVIADNCIKHLPLQFQVVVKRPQEENLATLHH